MALDEGIKALATALDHIVTHYDRDVRAVAVGAVPFLRLAGIVAGGWTLVRAALAARARMAAGDGDPFLAAKVTTARFYCDHVLVAASGLAKVVTAGGESALAVADDML